MHPCGGFLFHQVVESELFGYEKGAFTGASEQKKGRLELARGGTLFLDEIGDMSLSTQAKMLRVLEDQHFQRLGGTKTHHMDARIIVASNKLLPEEIQQGRFREDLFYRLNVIPLTIPPLRDRRDDIPLFVRHFLDRFAHEHSSVPKQITDGAMQVFLGYPWPGNVRELRNYIERLVIMVSSTVIDRQHLFPLGHVSLQPISSTSTLSSGSPLKQARAIFEREHILRALEAHNWNISRTAQVLQIERSHLHRKIKELRIRVTFENDR